MRKNIFILLYLLLMLPLLIMLSHTALAEISVKINEPIRFKDVNTNSLGDDYILGEGSLEISTDNEKEDIGKKIVLTFPEEGILSNKKNNIHIKKYSLETKDKSMIISTKKEIIKFFAIADRREIERNKDPQIIEGEYVGKVPIVLSLYKKVATEEVKK